MRAWWNLSVLAILLVGIWVGAAWSPCGASAAPDRVSPATGTALFAGTSGGTILRADSGAQWRIRQNLSGQVVMALAAARDGRTLYAATSSALWRSIDAGNHWSTTPGMAGGPEVNVLAVDPRDSAVVYAGTSEGLYQSTDGGSSWLVLNNGLPNDLVLSLAIDGHDPASVWAGTQDDGLYHSTDGGSSWTAVNDYVLLYDLTIQAIALSPASSSVIYAATNQGLFQSVDGGMDWTVLGGGFPDLASVSALAVSPSQPSRVYAGTYYGVYVSSDGGSTWAQGGGSLSYAQINALAVDPHVADRAYAATGSGVYRTTDGGASWSDWSGGDLGYDADVSALVLAPVQRVASDPVPPACCGARFFSQTGHNLSGAFLAFWQRYGGVDVFGYPRTEPFLDGGYVVQFTDRFELQLVDGRVVTAPLGRVLTAGRYFPPVAPFPATHDRLYFSSTGHSLSGQFLRYWQTHNGAVLLGAPIGEVTDEKNGDGTGRTYRVQWFEKGRLEYHAELAGTRYEVELGLLGKQDLQKRGWLP
jgi:photosystem II stability/assembly factor-like uncharacterized protein